MSQGKWSRSSCKGTIEAGDIVAEDTKHLSETFFAICAIIVLVLGSN